MYVRRPQGVSRSMCHWSRGTHFSGVRFWNFTASAPASTAPSMRRLASSSEPLWLMPISAITYTGAPAPTHLLPMRTRALSRVVAVVVMLGLLVSCASAQLEDPLREVSEGAVAAG